MICDNIKIHTKIKSETNHIERAICGLRATPKILYILQKKYNKTTNKCNTQETHIKYIKHEPNCEWAKRIYTQTKE